jgi:hypothetical protein
LIIFILQSERRRLATLVGANKGCQSDEIVHIFWQLELTYLSNGFERAKVIKTNSQMD